MAPNGSAKRCSETLAFVIERVTWLPTIARTMRRDGRVPRMRTPRRATCRLSQCRRAIGLVGAFGVMSDDLVRVPMLVHWLACLVLRRLLTPMVENRVDTKLIRNVLKLTGFSSLSRSLKESLALLRAAA